MILSKTKDVNNSNSKEPIRSNLNNSGGGIGAQENNVTNKKSKKKPTALTIVKSQSSNSSNNNSTAPKKSSNTTSNLCNSESQRSLRGNWSNKAIITFSLLTFVY